MQWRHQFFIQSANFPAISKQGEYNVVKTYIEKTLIQKVDFRFGIFK